MSKLRIHLNIANASAGESTFLCNTPRGKGEYGSSSDWHDTTCEKCLRDPYFINVRIHSALIRIAEALEKE